MKRDNKTLFIAALILAAVIFSFLTIFAFGEHKSKGFSTSARSAVLYQPETNNFLYCKNADTRLPMASTTKIMTALVALENGKMDEMVEVDDLAIGIEGSSAYLKKGDILTMEELIYALLLQSANDAAVAIACHIGGDTDEFVRMMNIKAKELGLINTNFANPNGLDDDDHYTTARELSLITANALNNSEFRKIVSTYKKTFTNGERVRTYVNHNKLLYLYEGCIGVKTGFTKKSGRCLVGAAEKDGLTFITVTLDAPNDWNDHSVMLNYGYDRMEKICLANELDYMYRIPVFDGEKSSITVGNTEGASIICERENSIVDEHIRLVRYAIAPIKYGDILGEIIYTVNGETVARVPLTATETVNKKEKQGFLYKILSIFDR